MGLTTQITRDKLILWFIKNEPEIYEKMCLANHNLNNFDLNIFHAEGTVFVHTMMVMTCIEMNKEKYTEDDYIVLLTSSLLHDTGKPTCLEEMPATEDKPRRNSFKGHEGVSSFNAVGILKKLKNDFPKIYTKEVIEKIIKVVSLHGTFVEETSDIYFLRSEFRKADKNGAVRSADEEIFSQYSPRKFLKPKNKEKNKNLTVLIGLPCSGKSSYREELLKNNPNAIVISRDDYLEKFFFEEMGEIMSYNNMYFTVHHDEFLLKKFTEQFNHLLRESSKSNNVIVDMTQLSLSTRRKMLSNFEKFNKKAVVIMTDNEELFKRNRKRFEETGKKITETIIENMMTTFAFPVLEEGFDSIELIIN